MVKSKWRRMSLDQIGDFSKGSGINRAESHTGDIPAVRYGELYTAHNNYIRNFVSHISREVADGAKRVHCGDVLFACSGETKEDIAKCAAVVDDIEAYAGGDIIILTPRIKVHPVFLGFMLNTPEVIKQRSSKAQGDAIVHISSETLKSIEISLPEYHEQTRIASALSNIDELTIKLEALIAKKKAIKYGAMQELLTGKKRLQGFSGEWQTFIFGELFDFIPNNAFTRAQMSDSGKVKNIHYGDILTKYGAYVDGGSGTIPYISKEVDLSRFADRCYLQSGDIIVADTAEDETVGKALEVTNVDCPILAGQHTLLCRPKIRFADKFLGYYLNAACYHDQLLPYIVGTKVSSVSKASVAQTKLIVPEYEEQQAIAEILSNMDAEIEALEQKLAKYHQVKQGMMQQLLTGKIRLV